MADTVNLPESHDELHDLALRYFEGNITPEKFDRLGRLLASDGDCVDAFFRLSQSCTTIRTTLRREQPDPSKSVSVASEGSAPTEAPAKPLPIYLPGCEPKPSRFRPHHFALAIAAAMLVAGIAVAIVSVVAEHNRETEIEQREIELAARRAAEPVATLIESSGGSLTTPTGYPSEGRDYPRGEYTLDAGTAEFMLTNSVNVKLRGASRMFMHNDMNVSITRGRAEFVVPRNATGFAVHLPDKSRIVDLGTAFTTRVDESGRVLAYVSEGSVRIETADGAAHVLAVGDSATVRDGVANVTRLHPGLADGSALAFDSPALADYATGWSDGDGGGVGFGAWSIFTGNPPVNHANQLLRVESDGTKPAAPPLWLFQLDSHKPNVYLSAERSLIKPLDDGQSIVVTFDPRQITDCNAFVVLSNETSKPMLRIGVRRTKGSYHVGFNNNESLTPVKIQRSVGPVRIRVTQLAVSRYRITLEPLAGGAPVSVIRTTEASGPIGAVGFNVWSPRASSRIRCGVGEMIVYAAADATTKGLTEQP